MTNPWVACWRGDGRKAKVLGRAGRLAAGDVEVRVEVDPAPSLLSFSSLSSGICCSAALCDNA